MGKYCIYPGCNKEDIAEDGRIPSCEYHKERRIKIVGRVAKVGDGCRLRESWRT